MRDFEEVADAEQAEKDAERILKGQFTMDDLLTQLRTIQKLGPLREVFAKMPMFGSMADKVDERELTKVESMIQSMTRGERSRPDVIDKSRAQRIADGSGRRPKEVHDLVDRFGQMRQLMGSLGERGGLLSKVPGMGRLAGRAGAPADFDPAALMAEGPTGPGRRARARQRSQQKRKRKQARKDRRKGRRK